MYIMYRAYLYWYRIINIVNYIQRFIIYIIYMGKLLYLYWYCLISKVGYIQRGWMG